MKCSGNKPGKENSSKGGEMSVSARVQSQDMHCELTERFSWSESCVHVDVYTLLDIYIVVRLFFCSLEGSPYVLLYSPRLMLVCYYCRAQAALSPELEVYDAIRSLVSYNAAVLLYRDESSDHFDNSYFEVSYYDRSLTAAERQLERLYARGCSQVWPFGHEYS